MGACWRSRGSSRGGGLEIGGLLGRLGAQLGHIGASSEKARTLTSFKNPNSEFCLLGPSWGASWSTLGAVVDPSRGLRRGRKNAPRAVTPGLFCVTDIKAFLGASWSTLGTVLGPSQVSRKGRKKSKSSHAELFLCDRSWGLFGGLLKNSRRRLGPFPELLERAEKCPKSGRAKPFLRDRSWDPLGRHSEHSFSGPS